MSFYVVFVVDLLVLFDLDFCEKFVCFMLTVYGVGFAVFVVLVVQLFVLFCCLEVLFGFALIYCAFDFGLVG